MTADLSHTEQRLRELGHELPPAPEPVACYIPVRVEGGLAYVSGQIPVRNGKPVATGTVPDAVSTEEAARCAELCTLNALANVKTALGSLDRVEGVVRVGCFVACGPGYADHPKVANGASELLGEVFGESGRHARAAVGCSSLPLGVPVEVEFVFALKPE